MTEKISKPEINCCASLEYVFAGYWVTGTVISQVVIGLTEVSTCVCVV